jgi:hypothetical protein
MNLDRLNERTPSEIDGALADLLEKLGGARYRLDGAKRALERFERRTAVAGWDRTEALRYAHDLETATAELERIAAEIAPLDAEFARRGGWTRYFHVIGGHVHRERSCSTCRPTTAFAWIPRLSGSTQSTMVEEFGDHACAVCFPAVVDHPAFKAAAEARRAMEAAEAASLCPSSGEKSPRGFRPGQAFKCSTCGGRARVTPRWNVRTHRRPEAAR